MGAPASAQVIAFRPKTGRPSRADELSLELAAREAEEQEMAAYVLPRIRHLRALSADTVTAATITDITAALTRHARRWAGEGDAA